MSNFSNEKKQKDKEIIGAVFLILGVILLWLLSWVFIDTFIPVTNGDGRGSFGDKFGAVNALFSGLAFAGVIYAILLQRKELELQREELKMTRGELEGQKLQLEAQNITFREQTLQNAFFQLLNFRNEILNGISFIEVDNEYKGRECLEYIYTRFQRINSRGILRNGKTEHFTHAELGQKFGELYRDNQNILSHYFRTLYVIFEFVHTNEFNNKNQYIKIVRTQLSAFELVLLFYNCEFGLGREKFKPLVEKYSLLKSLDTTLLLNAEHKDLYEGSAYN